MTRVIRNSIVEDSEVTIPDVEERPRPVPSVQKTDAASAVGALPVHFEAVAASVIQGEPARTAPLPDPAEAASRVAAELEAAKKRGYEEGLQRGLREGQVSQQAKVEQLSKLIEGCRTEVQARLARLDDDLVELAFIAITRILGDAMTTRDGVVAAINQIVEQHRGGAPNLVVRICPRDWQLLEMEGRQKLQSGRAMEIVSDDRVELGGCIIEGTRGSLDGRLETQLAKMKQALLDCEAGQRDAH